MTNYRRTTLSGATYFFTVNLLAHKQATPIEYIDSLRSAVREEKRNHPFHIDAWVVLPDHLHAIWTLAMNDADYSNHWHRIKANFSAALPANERRSASRPAKGERGIW
jgi:putative transposase